MEGDHLILSQRLANARTQHEQQQQKELQQHKRRKPQQSPRANMKALRPRSLQKALLNCIIDDSALLSGLAEQSSSNLKQWVDNGEINLFVPLYTLEKLNRLRASNPPTNLEARKALEWLDRVTSIMDERLSGRVALQGPDDQYKAWQEVERYLLPDTPLSTHTSSEGLMSMSDDFSQVHLSDDAEIPDRTGSSASSSALAPAITHCSPRTTASIPPSVRPLLNYVVWRTYHEDPEIGGTGKYVLLTNDPMTQRLAQKFGVRAKLLGQVGSIISRENKGSLTALDSTVTTKADEFVPTSNLNGNEPWEDEDYDEDEVVFDPSKRPGSSRSANKPTPKVWDPDHFGRGSNPPPPKSASPGASPILKPTTRVATPPPPSNIRGTLNGNMAPSTPAVTPAASAAATRGRGSTPRGAPLGQRNPMPAPMGNQVIMAAPSKPTMAAPSSPNQRGKPFAGRGNGHRGDRGRGTSGSGGQQRPGPYQYPKPIDPDSYVRPPPSMRRGRGNYKKLWDPNTTT